MEREIVVDIKDVSKEYASQSGKVPVLKNVSISINKGEFVGIVGDSGSGKTTLLNLIGGLYQPTEGTVTVDGVDLGTLREEELTVFRRRRVGFVFQDCSLVPELTVRENILLPLALDGSRPDRAFSRNLPDCWDLGRSWTASPICSPAAASSAPPLPGR